MRTQTLHRGALCVALALTACTLKVDDTETDTDLTQPLTSSQDTGETGNTGSEPTSSTTDTPGTETTDTPGTETSNTTPPATDTTNTTPPATETTATTGPDDTGPDDTSTGPDDTGPDDTSTGPDDTSTGPDDTSTGVGGLSFAADVYPVAIMPNCSCHVAGSGGLKLGGDAASAYAAIVDVSSGNGGLDYIEPGDPDLSYLWHKINGTQGNVMGGLGSQMPLGGMLSQANIDLITQWINEGALP